VNGPRLKIGQGIRYRRAHNNPDPRYGRVVEYLGFTSDHVYHVRVFDPEDGTIEDYYPGEYSMVPYEPSEEEIAAWMVAELSG
jgi:hypothetical protein